MEKNKIRNGYITPTLSGPESRQHCDATSAFSEVPNRRRQK